MTNETYSLYKYYPSPEHLALPPLLPSRCLDVLGQHLLNQHSLFYVFSPPAPVSPVSHIASIIFLRFLALFRLSPAFLSYAPRLLSQGSSPPHAAMVSLGRRVLRLWLLLLVGIAPLSRLLIHLYYHFVRFSSPISPPLSSLFPSPSPFLFSVPSLSSSLFPS